MIDLLPPADPDLAPLGSPPEPLPPAGAIAPAPAPQRRGSTWPAIGILAFLLLAAGEAYLWHRLQTLPQPPPSDAAQLASLQAEVTVLQNAPVSGGPAAATTATPTAVPTAANTAVPAAAPAPLAAPADTDFTNRLGTLNALVDALQTQFIADHNALNAVQTASAGLPELTADVAALQAQASAEHTALGQLQTSTTGLDKLTARITILSQLQTARMALDAGQPVGAIPHAPPALAAFASTPPPTEASLILGFPAAARAGQSASVAGAARGTYWSSVRSKIESLVTVSDGGHVIIGAPAAALLNQAQDLLNAGDLAGAVAAINTLSPTTQAAMGSWLVQARALVAARNAIAVMAAQA